MEKEEFEKYQNFSSSVTSDGCELFESLTRWGFLVNEDTDELAIVRDNINSMKYQNDVLHLTIAPTTACNFRCPYCYEKDTVEPLYMNAGTEKAIVSMVEACAQSNKIKGLDVSWYGGEPLLALDIIKSISKRFIQICTKNNIEYTASIVTNGYLFNGDGVSTINESQIKFVQITIDGMEESHNKRRPLMGKRPSFKTIVSNLVMYAPKVPFVTIRVNVDKENHEDANRLRNYLRQFEFNNVSLYMARTEKQNDSYDADMCFSKEEFSLLNAEFQELNGEERLNIKEDFESIKGIYPKRKANFCGADSAFAQVIGPDGYIYKCWADIGVAAKTLGNINNPESISKTSAYLDYVAYDPTTDSMCSECEYLPLCSGGCPMNRLQNDNLIDRCDEIKYSLETKLLALMPGLER